MTKKNREENPQGIKNVEETLTRTEKFLEDNYKNLIIALGVVIILVAAFYLGKLYMGKKNEEAKAQMYQAEKWLEMDSLNLALNGDGNYLGFIDISEEYRMTRAGNMAKYAAGICYLHLGQFEDAIDYLSDYSVKDKLIGSLAKGALGDAYVELGDMDRGVAGYIEAADLADNSFNTPIFLLKAGEIYELQGKYGEAIKVYERIRDEYPESTEGLTIEKYISRVNLLMK